MTERKRAIGGNEKGLPDSLRPFFWDVDFESLHIEDQSFFIIGRLLEHGDESSVRFLLNTYSEDEITQVLRTSRSLSMRSRGFWMTYFDAEGEPCSPKQYLAPLLKLLQRLNSIPDMASCYLGGGNGPSHPTGPQEIRGSWISSSQKGLPLYPLRRASKRAQGISSCSIRPVATQNSLSRASKWISSRHKSH